MTTDRQAEIEVAVDLDCRLAEGPIWDDRLGELIFVDIVAGHVHRFDPGSGAHRSYEVGQPVGAAAPRVGEGLVLAVRDGFAALNLQTGAVTPIAAVPRAPGAPRMNDGKVDPAGRFWAGTLSEDGVTGAGSLHRLDPDGTVATVLAGVTVSNGLAWSRDASTMYYIDSATQRVDAFAFEPATGTLGARRGLIDIPPELGQPDGMTVDEEGFLWIALFGGGQVRRFSHEGALDQVIALPVSNVTSCTFGGPDLGDLFITTATHRLRTPEPLAGAVFRCRPGPRGLSATRYGG